MFLFPVRKETSSFSRGGFFGLKISQHLGSFAKFLSFKYPTRGPFCLYQCWIGLLLLKLHKKKLLLMRLPMRIDWRKKKASCKYQVFVKKNAEKNEESERYLRRVNRAVQVKKNAWDKEVDVRFCCFASKFSRRKSTKRLSNGVRTVRSVVPQNCLSSQRRVLLCFVSQSILTSFFAWRTEIKIWLGSKEGLVVFFPRFSWNKKDL